MSTSLSTSQTKLELGRRKTGFTLSPSAVRLLSVTFFLVVWEVAGRHVNPIFLSYPTAILIAGWEMLVSGELVRESIRSFYPFLVGFGLSIIFGVLIGIMMGADRRIEYALDPFITALYSTPNVALIPLLILWLGLGVAAKIAVVFLISFFPIVVSTFSGVKNISGSLVEIGHSFGHSRLQILWKIILPGSIPFITTGIRLAVGRAVVGIVVAEFFTAISGLGGMIIKYSNKLETDRMLVPIVLLAVFGVLLTELVKLFERKVAPWKNTDRAELP